MTKTQETAKNLIEQLFSIGAHFGFSKSRRHPSTAPFIFGSKNKVDIFDLEKTDASLQKAIDYVATLATTKGSILFVGGKHEAQQAIKKAAESADLPYVAGRWIGGALTNFGEIRKRVDTMLSLMSQKAKGELDKYTKKERLLIDRDIEKLERMFWGIKDMTTLPKALFIVDPRYEASAVREAQNLNIPVIALCSSDNDIKTIDFPIVANDASAHSISFFANKLATAYTEARSKAQSAQ